MLSKEEIERKLEQTEDDEITINLLYQKIDLLESDNYEQNNIINNYIEEREKLIEKLEEIRTNLEKDGFVGYADNEIEIIELLKEMQENALNACRYYKKDGTLYRDEKAEQKVNAIETVLNYIENSIPKESNRKVLGSKRNRL